MTPSPAGHACRAQGDTGPGAARIAADLLGRVVALWLHHRRRMGTPRQLGKYRLLRHLATGGMAEIWLAESPTATVVIKVIAPDRARDRTFVQMFLDEARVAGALYHANIATMYEVGRDGDTYFHAIEYVHGQNARAMVERSLYQRATVPLAVTVGIGTAVANALHYAHERKGTTGEQLDIVHRDVTPSNIMIGWDGVVKLVDFGVALASRRAAETRTGVVKGKLAYMSPEQCRGKKVDRRADVFALGVTLYELSTQRRAFRCGSEYQTMERIVRGDLPAPSTVIKDYPPALEAIIMRALATDLTARWQTAAELAAALEGFRREHGVEEPKAAVARFMRQMFGEPRSPQEDAAAAAAAEARAGTEPPVVAAAEPTGETGASVEPTPPPAPVPTGPMPVVPPPTITTLASAAIAVERPRSVEHPRPVERPDRRRRIAAAAIAAGAIAAAIMTLVLLGGRAGSRAAVGAATSLGAQPTAAPSAPEPAMSSALPDEPPPAPVQPERVVPVADAAVTDVRVPPGDARTRLTRERRPPRARAPKLPEPARTDGERGAAATADADLSSTRY